MEETTSNDNKNFGASTAASPPPPSTFNQAPVRRLYRTEGPISGVSGGLADYFGVDASIVRLVIIVGSLMTFPAIPLAYAAAWMIIPEANPAPVPPIMPPAPTSYPVPPAPVDDLAVDDSVDQVVPAS